ncbi:MAG: tetratricopeptide repeat protein [Chthoniobacterales bacterium]|nr:tetratricopeptide repeat protein [Chthoniobacterales bacterium]
MSTERERELQLEIGHVLFIDIVGYSKLLINEQSEALHKLNDLVRATERVRAADAAGKLIRLPSGDGMALVFRDSPESPAHCALEISQALKAHPEIRVRMGIHSGPINEIADVNERANIAGGGINTAQRVMDCGDAGHILLSKRVADDLAQYREWQPRLHDLGDCEVKHGVTVSLSNLHTGELGNPAVPTKLRQHREANAATKAADARSMRSRRKNVITGVALVLAFLLPIIYWVFNPLKPKRRAAGPSPSATLARVPEKRIAVLPFKPLIAETRDPVLELGMADSLITKLSNSREIIVTSLTSVRKFGDLDQDPLSAGRELGVTSVLEGNLQRAGDQIRVTARLINVADGASLWAGTFDEKFTDVFTVQNTISQKVADALALRLSGDERARLTKRDTENLEAYELFLTGRFHWNKLTPPELTKSIGFFKQAIELDPSYAPAYFGLADSYRALSMTGDVRPKDIFPQARAAAVKAIEIDEWLAEPHVTLAFIHIWFDWDWAGAEREARRAIELNPNLAFGHAVLGQVLQDLGRFDEATVAGARARQLDPVSPIICLLEGAILFYANRDEAAAASLRKALELNPNFWLAHLYLGNIHTRQRRFSEAIPEFEAATELSGRNSQTISMRGYASANAGDAVQAQTALDELERLSTQRYIPPSSVAVILSALGESDQAFAWLEKACEERDLHLSFLRVDPKWDALRSDPRFASLLKRIGFH